jgi:hypothetical protein
MRAERFALPELPTEALHRLDRRARLPGCQPPEQSESSPDTDLASAFDPKPQLYARAFADLFFSVRYLFRIQTSSSHTTRHAQSHVGAPINGSSTSHRRHPFVMT